MINLNSPEYNMKQPVDADLVLNKVSDYNIWKFYYPELVVNQLTNSPLRHDKKPSFSVFWSKRYNKLFFKDFATGKRGDVFVFLTEYLSLSYYEVLEKIVIDFNLTDYFYIKDIQISSSIKPIIYSDEYVKSLIKDSVRLNIKIRDWNKYDLQWWNTFGVNEYILKRFKVLPISHIFINDDIIKADKLAYCYTERKDNVLRFKIYQPLSKKMKWINNMVEGTLSGWSQMKDNGDILIIASSLKDAMCLYSIGFINVIAPQTENYIHKEHIINHLKERFKNIYVFYDYDKAGINASNRLKDEFNIKQLFTFTKELKDPSDFYRAKGREELLKLIYKQL